MARVDKGYFPHLEHYKLMNSRSTFNSVVKDIYLLTRPNNTKCFLFKNEKDGNSNKSPLLIDTNYRVKFKETNERKYK